jgi:hypothetical protein
VLEFLGAISTNDATAYPDNRDQLLYYVLPNVPTFRRDGDKAAFKFIEYRTLSPLPNGKFGAALVFMDVQLALEPAQEAALRKKLAEVVTSRRGQGSPPVTPEQIVLSQPSFTKADVTVNILASSGNLVQRVNNAGKASMYGKNVVAISAELTEQGAAAFASAMQSQGLGGVQVNYALEFVARLPPVTAEGRWTANKFYSFIQEVEFTERCFQADDFSERVSEVFAGAESRNVTVDPGQLDNTKPEVAKMIESLTNSVTTQLDEAIKRNLVEAIPPENRDFSAIRQQDIEKIRRDITVNKSSDVRITYTANQNFTFTPEPQANMPSLVSQGFAWADYATRESLDSDFFKRLNLTIQVSAEFEDLRISSIEVSIDYPPHTAAQGIKTFLFRSADDIGKFGAFTDGGPTAHKYQYVVHYRGNSQPFTSQWLPHDGEILQITVDDLGMWVVDVEPSGINFDLVTRADVTLEHPGSVAGAPLINRFQIDKTTTTHRVRELLLRPVQPYSASITFFMSDGREFVRKLENLRGERLYVDDPFTVSPTIRVRSRGDFDRHIETIFLDLVYRDRANHYEQNTSIALSKDKRFFDWTFPIIDAAAGEVTYRAITTFKNAPSQDTGELPVSGTTLLLGEEIATLVVRMMADLVPWEQVRLVRLEIHYVDEPNHIDERETFVFRAGSIEQKLELSVRDHTKMAYTWTATYFMTDGSKRAAESPGPVTDEVLILELPPARP